MMTFRAVKRGFITATLLLAVGFAPHGVRAADLALPAFFGTFQGTGIAESRDNIYAPETVRDLDIVIAPAGDGFTVQWTTVIRNPGTGKAKRKTQTLTFEPTGTGSQYRSRERIDPWSEDGLSWAGIKDRVLSVYVLNILEDGRAQVQRYARELTSLGMELQYSRQIDSEELRTVKARLVKAAQ